MGCLCGFGVSFYMSLMYLYCIEEKGGGKGGDVRDGFFDVAAAFLSPAVRVADEVF